MNVLKFLLRFYLPSTRERTPGHQPTRSELRRWCEQHAVHINGHPRHWNDSITLPVWQLIFFPHSHTHRTTYIDDHHPQHHSTPIPNGVSHDGR